MSIYLRLELETEGEVKDWESVKKFLGSRSNTDALRVLIKRTALEATKTANENAKQGAVV